MNDLISYNIKSLTWYGYDHGGFTKSEYGK